MSNAFPSCATNGYHGARTANPGVSRKAREGAWCQHRAPKWLKALVAAHAVTLAVVLGLVATDTDIQMWTTSLVLATFFGSVGVLMGWYGQFTPPDVS